MENAEGGNQPYVSPTQINSKPAMLFIADATRDSPNNPVVGLVDQVPPLWWTTPKPGHHVTSPHFVTFMAVLLTGLSLTILTIYHLEAVERDTTAPKAARTSLPGSARFP